MITPFLLLVYHMPGRIYPQIELGILINARGPCPIWPAAGRVRVEEFENLQWRVRVRVKIILSGAGAGQSNLSRGYSLTRKFKKKRFFFLKKCFFIKNILNLVNIYIILIINILF